jgi:hypothetical protein
VSQRLGVERKLQCLQAFSHQGGAKKTGRLRAANNLPKR